MIYPTFAASPPSYPSSPTAPPAPDETNAFGCWFYLARACDQGRDSWRPMGWNHDSWGTNNDAADSEYRCEHVRPPNWDAYCFVDSPDMKTTFQFRSGVLNTNYAISSNLLLTSNHTAIVDGYDVSVVTYMNASMYPQTGNLIVRSNTLTIANADVGGYIRNHGAVYVSGGTFHVTSTLCIGRQGFGEVKQSGGTITVDGDLDASMHATGTSLIHQTGGIMNVGTLNMGTTSSHAHLLVRGTLSVGDLTIRDDYSTIPTGSHKTRIVVGSGGVLTVTERLSIPDVHDQIELHGGRLTIAKFWDTTVQTDVSKHFITMFHGSSLVIYTSVSGDDNPCDNSGSLNNWYVQHLLDPAYSDQANKNFRPVMGEDNSKYNIQQRCIVESTSSSGYAMEVYVEEIESPPPSPPSRPPTAPPVPPSSPPLIPPPALPEEATFIGVTILKGNNDQQWYCVTNSSATSGPTQSEYYENTGINIQLNNNGEIALQCCDVDATQTCRRKLPPTNACAGGSQWSSLTPYNASAAASRCAEYGYTLCEKTCMNMGCAYDHLWVWTSIPCNLPPSAPP